MIERTIGLEFPSYVLTPSQMGVLDRNSAKLGISSWDLMCRAGEAVANYILRHYASVPKIAVLCGPGNNGGDGYVAAAHLLEAGLDVTVWKQAEIFKGQDAERAARNWRGSTRHLSEFQPSSNSLVIDALYGAGLRRPLEGFDLVAIHRTNQSGAQVVAVDVPSGVDGETGQVLGASCQAERTITFVCKKPAHLILPGREACGEIIVADIGISLQSAAQFAPHIWENTPGLWRSGLPRFSTTVHKYQRGHVAVLSGGKPSTGAARLSASAAARSGAGAVTILSPPDAVGVHAAHLTATMVHEIQAAESLLPFLMQRKVRSLVVGPGFGTGLWQAALVDASLNQTAATVVLDADALTIISKNLERFVKSRRQISTDIVMTPHDGEFARLFPDLHSDRDLSKVQRARQAAIRSSTTIVYKGADTVIAASDGRAVINANGTPWLATAGSGDVLAGLIASLLGQGMEPFKAASAAVWIHAEAGRHEGFGLTAEDLPQRVRTILAEMLTS